MDGASKRQANTTNGPGSYFVTAAAAAAARKEERWTKSGVYRGQRAEWEVAPTSVLIIDKRRNGGMRVEMKICTVR